MAVKTLFDVRLRVFCILYMFSHQGLCNHSACLWVDHTDPVRQAHLSVLRLPLLVVLHITRFLAALTAHSALPLDRGYQAENSQSFTPQPFNHSFISGDVRFIPLSQDISLGTPITVNSSQSTLIRLAKVLLPGVNQQVLFSPRVPVHICGRAG